MLAEYFVGKIKETEGQVKKHYSQMSQREKEYLLIKIFESQVSGLTFGKHALEKITKETSKEDILSIISRISTSNIIEYNEVHKYGKTDKRVLIRNKDKKTVAFSINKNSDDILVAEANLCIVVSITYDRIITCYWNRVKDLHKISIHMDRYDKNLKII